MLSDKQLAFIGSGVMGEAMIQGLLRQNMVPAENIIASGPRQERGDRLVERYSVRATRDNREAASEANVLVLSVKALPLGSLMVKRSLAALNFFLPRTNQYG